MGELGCVLKSSDDNKQSKGATWREKERRAESELAVRVCDQIRAERIHSNRNHSSDSITAKAGHALA